MGAPADEDPQAAGPPGDPDEVARIVCLRMLDRRAYTRAELTTALRKRGVPDESAQRVLDRFAELKLIDDAALADGYALAQHQDRGLAGRAVALKLRQRGVDEHSVRSAVAQIDRESEVAAATALVQRRLRSLRELPEPVQARRLVGLLGRKGYSPGLAHEVVRGVLHSLDGEVEDFPLD
ncbi:MAG TPA: regulatory protein RecX [Jatrophihabitans sp.]|jgi:regulatory protein